uniref:Putative odorant receptor 33 n=1 Tax=Conopomorpha sinensis TaxID=940481 RepID=A0A3S7SGN7_9NEOP|nr:putative odorant receptor 33 [Conopomorpha sinensis]
MSLNSDYKKLFHEYIQTFHLFHHKDKSEYANQTHLLVHNISHFFTIMLTSQMCIGIFLFNATPLYNNMSSGVFKDNSLNRTYELSVYVTLPIGDPERDLRYYVAVMLFDWHISFFCSVTFCMFDLYLSLMIFQIWGHLRILKHELLVFTKPKHGQCLYSDVESNLVNLKLKKLVQYHCFIMNFANQVSNTFGAMIFAYYVFHQVSCCLLLLECSQLDPKAVARYGPLTLIVFQQLMQISIVFELVGSKSEELIEATYNLPWQCMDASRRAVVQLLLMRVQRPLHLKALGMTDVGVRSMATIIKTSMSYFTLLRNS